MKTPEMTEERFYAVMAAIGADGTAKRDIGARDVLVGGKSINAAAKAAGTTAINVSVRVRSLRKVVICDACGGLMNK